jgi:hypothetical protein
MRVLRQTLLSIVILSFLFFHPVVSWGIIALRHDLEVEGFLQAENILRTPMFQDAKVIMQRNRAQIEAKYHFLRGGRRLDCSLPVRLRRPPSL